MPRQRKKTAIDFEDEDAVLADVAKALEADRDECFIEEDRGLSGFGEGTVYRFDWGTQEYNVAENHDQAYALAVEVVKQDLEQEPEIFNKDFIESHIDKDKLRDALHGDVVDMRIEDLADEAERTEGSGRTTKARDSRPPKKTRTASDRSRANADRRAGPKQAEEQLQDPMEYLEDIYGKEDAVRGHRIAGIDIDAAAEDAVDTDGWEHFLARYDGNSHETAVGARVLESQLMATGGG